MTQSRYVPMEFGASESPVSSDVLSVLVYVQTTCDVAVSLHLQVKTKPGYDPWYEAVALALAGESHPKGTLFSMVQGRWPNSRHRTLSAMLYRLVMDLEEVIAKAVEDRANA